MHPRVQIAHGPAYDVLLAAAAVADRDWRATFDTGSATYQRVREVAGDELVQRVTGFGRFGWLNLLGLVASEPGDWGLDRLVDAVRDLAPDDLHLRVIGGDRRQLLDVVARPVLRAAVAGDLQARAELETGLTSEDLVVEVAPWLLRATSEQVQIAMVAVLTTWRERLLSTEDESSLASILRAQAATAATVLATSPGHAFLETAIGGLHYEPAGLDRVVSVSSTQVAPVVIVVDGTEQTVIVHPPLDSSPERIEAPARLLEIGRAVGDKTRMQLLLLLQDSERTAVELAHGMGAPRTTLLHHLAILRAAGLVHVTVTPGGATVYRLRPEGFDELARAAVGFVPTR